MSNQWCHICGGLVDHIGLQPQDVRLCACGGKIAKFRARIAELETEVERLRAEIHEIASVLPGVAYMDPPDGGSPSLPEQFRRMRADLDRTAAERDALRADAERYRWLRGDQCDIVVGTNPGAMDYGMSGVFGTYDDWLGGDELDAAIDAARGES